jgi:hypothetical protein
MDTVERAAKALAEWELGLSGDQVDQLRYGTALPERRALVDQLWRGKVEQAAHVLRAINYPQSPDA